MNTTVSDSVSDEMNGDTVDDAAEALLSRFMPEGDPDAPKKKPSTDEVTKKTETKPPEPEDDDETSEEAPEDEDESEGKEKPAAKKHVDDDEAYVKIKEGDDEHEVPVKDLKRLWGQEAALTRKSQEVAEQRKTVEAENLKTTTALSTLLQRAKEKSAPYEAIDFLVASKDLSAEDLKALRDEAKVRSDEVKFLETELSGFVQAANAKQQAAFADQAKACVTALKDADSPHHIPDWGDKVYNELRDFAVTEGLNANVFNQLVDPASMKLLNMAMQFKRGLSKVLTTKVNKTPTKITKTSVTPVASKGSKAAEDKAMKRLRTDQSTDAAADLFLKRWENKSSDD